MNADLDLADLRKGIVGAGIVGQGKRALRAGEVIRSEPVFAHDNRVGGNAADLLDEACEVESDMRIAWFPIGSCGGVALRFPRTVALAHPRETAPDPPPSENT